LLPLLDVSRVQGSYNGALADAGDPLPILREPFTADELRAAVRPLLAS
jgi:hypothetical protein